MNHTQPVWSFGKLLATLCLLLGVTDFAAWWLSGTGLLASAIRLVLTATPKQPAYYAFLADPLIPLLLTFIGARGQNHLTENFRYWVLEEMPPFRSARVIGFCHYTTWLLWGVCFVAAWGLLRGMAQAKNYGEFQARNIMPAIVIELTLLIIAFVTKNAAASPEVISFAPTPTDNFSLGTA